MKFKPNKQEIHNKNTCQSDQRGCHHLSSNLNYQCSMLETRKLNHPKTTRDIYSLCQPFRKIQTLCNDQICKYHTSNSNTIQSQSLSLLQSRGTPQSSPKKKSKRISVDKCAQCLSNRSCSREKFLSSKIDHMLKQQQQKIILLNGNAGNRINFLNNNAFLQNQVMKLREKDETSKQSNKKIKRQRQLKNKYRQIEIENMKLDINSVPQLNQYMLSEQKDKENDYNLNKMHQKGERLHTEKSNKLTLRNYINTTPALTESLVNSFDTNNIGKNNQNSDKIANDESRVQSQRERLTPMKNMNIKNNQVLKQVREIKGMFLELLNKKQESKTKKKCYNFMKSENQQSKQAFTFHD